MKVLHVLPHARHCGMARELECGVACCRASGSAAGKKCGASGMPPAEVRVVPSGVRAWAATASPHACYSAKCKPHLLCVGALETSKGFYEAIWAFDFFGYL